MSTAYVQDKAAATAGTAQSTAFTLTFTSATTSGNLILVHVASASGSGGTNTATNSISDNKSNVYTLLKSQTVGTTGRVETWYSAGITGGASHTITVTPGDNRYLAIDALEYSGTATSSPTDGTPNSSSGAGVSSSTTGSITTTGSSDVVAVAQMQSLGHTNTIGGGFTGRAVISDSGGNCRLDTGDQVNAAAGTYTGSWTWTGSDNYATTITAFKAAAVIDDGTMMVSREYGWAGFAPMF